MRATHRSGVRLNRAVPSLMPVLATPVGRGGLTIGLFVALTWINIRGVALGARVVELITLAKLVPLAVLIVAGVVGFRRGNFVVTHAPAVLDVGRASLILI